MDIAFLKQTWTASGVLLNMLAQGLAFSYPASLLPGLKAPDSDIQVDLETESWLSSSVGLSSILGIFMTSFLMEWRGRRFSHAALIIPALFGWILIYLAPDVQTLMAGRILTGITVGGTLSLGGIVIGEYTSPQHRGMFLNLKTNSVSVASILQHNMSYYLHWRTIAIICLVPQIITFIIVCTWPESPSWLASKKKFKECEESFYSLRGRNEASRAEFEELMFAQRERLSKIPKNLSILEHIMIFLKKFTMKDFLMPTVIVFILALVLEFSGRHVFAAYALHIVGNVAEDKTQTYYYALGIDIIILMTTTLSAYFVKIFQRRTLLFGSGVVGFTLLVAICVYLYLVSQEIAPNLPGVSLGLFALYFIAVNSGCTPIPLTIMGEIFPLHHRGVGAAISGLSLAITIMLTLQITPGMLVNLHVYGTFAVFATVMAASLLLLYFLLPETKDKTLQQIEGYFNKELVESRGKNRDEGLSMIS